MMTLVKKRFFYVLFVGVLTQISCGPAKPLVLEAPVVEAPPPQNPKVQGPSQGVAARLGIRLVPGKGSRNGDQGFPKPDFSLPLQTSNRVEEGIKYSENTVAYARVLEISPNRNSHASPFTRLFFVWPESSLGSKIVNASVIHQILDGHNRLIGS